MRQLNYTLRSKELFGLKRQVHEDIRFPSNSLNWISLAYAPVLCVDVIIVAYTYDYVELW